MPTFSMECPMRAVILAVAAASAVLAVDAFAQTETPKQTEPTKGYTGAYAPAGTPPTPYSTGALPQVDNGSPGLDVAAPDGSTKSVRAIPCSAAAQETDGSTTCVGIEKQR
jgi:hypothetical protein